MLKSRKIYNFTLTKNSEISGTSEILKVFDLFIDPLLRILQKHQPTNCNNSKDSSWNTVSRKVTQKEMGVLWEFFHSQRTKLHGIPKLCTDSLHAHKFTETWRLMLETTCNSFTFVRQIWMSDKNDVIWFQFFFLSL